MPHLNRLSTYHVKGTQDCRSVVFDGDGLVIAGSANDDPSSPVGYIVKTWAGQGDGWQKTYSLGTMTAFMKMIRPRDDNLCVVGAVWTSESSQDSRGLFLRLDEGGEVVKQHLIGPEGGGCVAGDVACGADGGFVIVSPLADSPKPASLITKLSATGDPVWENRLDGRFALAVAASEGGYLIAGSAPSSGECSQTWAMQIDGDGKPQWDKTYEQFEACPLLGLGAANVDRGEWVVVGPGFAFRLNGDGDLVWKTALDGRKLSSVALSEDGELLTAGTVVSQFGDTYAYTAAMDPAAGNVLWENCALLSSSDASAAIGPEPGSTVFVGSLPRRTTWKPETPEGYDAYLSEFIA